MKSKNIIISLSILVILFVYACGLLTCKTYMQGREVTLKDSIVYDTIIKHLEVIKYVSEPIPIRIIDSVFIDQYKDKYLAALYKIDSIKAKQAYSSFVLINSYQKKYDLSLGSLLVFDTVNGQLLNQNIIFTPDSSKLITKTVYKDRLIKSDMKGIVARTTMSTTSADLAIMYQTRNINIGVGYQLIGRDVTVKDKLRFYFTFPIYSF